MPEALNVAPSDGWACVTRARGSRKWHVLDFTFARTRRESIALYDSDVPHGAPDDRRFRAVRKSGRVDCIRVAIHDAR